MTAPLGPAHSRVKTFSVLLGPSAPGGENPPEDLPDAPYEQQRLLTRWFDSHQHALQALAEAVARTHAHCVVSLSADPDLLSWFRRTDPSWQEPFADGRHAERLLVRFVRKLSEVLSPTLEQTLFDLRRKDDWRWITARHYCHDVPLLIVGVDPEHAELRSLLRRLRRRTPGPAGALVWPRPVSPTALAELEDMGFELIAGNPISALQRDLLARDAKTPEPRRLRARRPRSPYRQLDAYHQSDADLFFGRDRLAERLIRLTRAYSLVIVTGASGNGKTSLVNAGLLAHMKQVPGAIGVTVRCEADPVGGIVRALQDELPPAHRPAASNSLREYLDKLRARHFPVIVLDQGEEIYTRLGERPRAELLKSLREVLCHSPQLATFVISLREDFLSNLAELRATVPSLLQTTLYVPPFSRDEAREAILEPAAAFELPFDRDLAEAILEELSSGNRGTVAPPQMQIVCSRLYDQWVARGRPEAGITFDLHVEAGGCGGILGDFVEHSLRELQTSGREALGWTVLKAMVTSEGTKDLLTLDDIARRANLDRAVTAGFLEYFGDKRRLVRPVTHDRGQYFELAHEYLVSSIWHRMSDADRRRRQVEEDLARELLAWEHFSDVSLGLDRLERYSEFPDLVVRHERALTLVLLSTIKNLQPASAWIPLVASLPPSQQDHHARELLRYVDGRDKERQRQAAEALGRLPPKVLSCAMRDQDAQVRAAALQIAAALDRRDALPQIAAALGEAHLSPEVKKDLFDGLLRMWGRERSPDGPFQPGERVALDGLLASTTLPGQASFAFTALMDLGRDKGFNRVREELISSHPNERSAVITSMTSLHASAFGRYLRVARRRQPADRFWPALAQLTFGEYGLARELLNFKYLTEGGWLTPSPLPQPRGWPLSKAEVRRALKSIPSATWLAPCLKRLIGEDESGLDDDCTQAQARAFIRGKPFETVLTALAHRPRLLIRLLDALVRPRERTDTRRALIYAFEGSRGAVDILDDALWQRLSRHPDEQVRAGAFAAMTAYGRAELAQAGLADPENEVQWRVLSKLSERPRPEDNRWWKPHLDRMVTRHTEVADLIGPLLVAARHGLADTAVRGLPTLGPRSSELLDLIEHFVQQADARELNVIVEVSFFAKVLPPVVTRARVLRNLAPRWERLERGEELLALSLSHGDQLLRAAAADLAWTSQHLDALKLLMADSAVSVRTAAWQQLLVGTPDAFPMSVESLLHLLTAPNTPSALQAVACQIVGHYRIVEATNALKELADDTRPSGIKGTSIGQLARKALLLTWPDAAAWIRLTRPNA